MKTNQKAIGILGGTFDPVHFGHLRMAYELARHLALAKVHLVPAFQPVHRTPPVASAEDRLAMVTRAIAGEPLFVADPREMTRKGQSYTIDTLADFRAEMPETSLCLLIGADAFLEINTWHRYTELLDHAHLIVAHRPGFHPPEQGPVANMLKAHQQEDPTTLLRRPAGGIMLVATTGLDISATEIRKEIAMGGHPRYLLPDDVYYYIQQNGTYQR